MQLSEQQVPESLWTGSLSQGMEISKETPGLLNCKGCWAHDPLFYIQIKCVRVNGSLSVLY